MESDQLVAAHTSIQQDRNFITGHEKQACLCDGFTFLKKARVILMQDCTKVRSRLMFAENVLSMESVVTVSRDNYWISRSHSHILFTELIKELTIQLPNEGKTSYSQKK